jgi:hypothetical protein
MATCSAGDRRAGPRHHLLRRRPGQYVDTAEFGIYEIDPNRSHVHFDSPNSSVLKRSDENGDRGTWVSKAAELDFGTNADGSARTIARVRLLAFRPDDSDVVLVGGGWGRLHLSQDNGVTFDVVEGPDGAGNTVPFLPTGATFGRPTAIAFAPTNNNVVYLGTSNGNLWRSATGGLTSPAWTALPGLPVPGLIQAIAVHPDDSDVLYVGISTQGLDQIFRSVTGGQTWEPVTGAVPLAWLPQYPLRSIVIDPDQPDRLFVALRVGLFVSPDAGETWEPFDDGLPRVTIGGLRLRAVTRTLYLATEGRGIFSHRI